MSLSQDDLIISLFCKYQLYKLKIDNSSARDLATQINDSNNHPFDYNCRLQLKTILHSQIESDNEKKERERLENIYKKENVFDTEQFKTLFRNLGFIAPLVRVEKDGLKGIILFQHFPRFYFDFMPIENILDETLTFTKEIFDLCLPEENFILTTALIENTLKI